jgi:hypothetical protein
MATCVKCAAVLISQARFCAACGSPVTRGSVPPAAASPKSVAASVPDPFARTVLGDDVSAVLAAAKAAPISPMAASLMAAQNAGSPAPAPANPQPAAYAPQPAAYAAQPAAYAPQPYAAQPAPQAQYTPPVPQPAHNIAPGTLVLVYWADGQRYPGTVLQVSAQHLFVAFPNGIQQWIDVRYVTVGA